MLRGQNVDKNHLLYQLSTDFIWHFAYLLQVY